MSEYITLQHATKFCPYTQEYLSLRARQGKLKALKLDRNWVCTKEWLQEYVRKSEDYKKQKENREIFVEPPRNLPIYAPDAEMWEEEIPEDSERQKKFQRNFQFALALAMMAALFLVSIFQGHQQVFRVAENVSPVVISAAVALGETMQAKGFTAGKGVQIFLGAASPAGASGEGWGIGEIAKEYIGWVGDQVRRIAKVFVLEPPTPQADSVPRAESRGVVVVPSSANEADDEKVKEQIKQSFSDEVNITPYDEESGIITPVFRHRAGKDYLYILVPLRDENSK